MKPLCAIIAILGLHLEAADPVELTRARSAYKQDADRALAPVKAAYGRELERLIDAFGRAGKLDEAVAVKDEQTKLNGGVVPPRPNPRGGLTEPEELTLAAGKIVVVGVESAAERLRARFVGRTFVTPSGTYFTFGKDGAGDCRWKAGKDSFKWELVDDRTVMVQRPDKRHYFWFESKYKGQIADAKDATRRPVTSR